MSLVIFKEGTTYRLQRVAISFRAFVIFSRTLQISQLTINCVIISGDSSPNVKSSLPKNLDRHLSAAPRLLATSHLPAALSFSIF